jgi:AcrR family transcriptional regulator
MPTRSRRDQIVATAATLFAERGYHGVSVTDLGAACGVSGPALYRHFASKDAVLAEMLVGTSERLLREGRRRVAGSGDVHGALAALVSWHVEFALEHPELIVVQVRDWASLPDDVRARVRTLQLRYIDVWVDALRRARPELDRPTARACCQAAFGLLNSTPHSARLSEQRMRELLERMALAALLA